MDESQSTFTTAQLAGVRARGISSALISDDAVNAITNECLPEFGRFRTVLKTTQFTVNALQQKYDWNADIGDATGITVLGAYWSPFQIGNEWNLARVLATVGVMREAGDWNFPSLQQLIEIKSAAFADAFNGTWFQQDIMGGPVYLNPVPEVGGMTCWLLYTATHASDFSTVRAIDSDIYLDLMCWRACNAIAMSIASMPNTIKTAELQVQNDKQIAFWRTTGLDYRASFIDNCQQGYAVADRT